MYVQAPHTTRTFSEFLESEGSNLYLNWRKLLRQVCKDLSKVKDIPTDVAKTALIGKHFFGVLALEEVIHHIKAIPQGFVCIYEEFLEWQFEWKLNDLLLALEGASLALIGTVGNFLEAVDDLCDFMESLTDLVKEISPFVIEGIKFLGHASPEVGRILYLLFQSTYKVIESIIAEILVHCPILVDMGTWISEAALPLAIFGLFLSIGTGIYKVAARAYFFHQLEQKMKREGWEGARNFLNIQLEQVNFLERDDQQIRHAIWKDHLSVLKKGQKICSDADNPFTEALEIYNGHEEFDRNRFRELAETIENLIDNPLYETISSDLKKFTGAVTSQNGADSKNLRHLTWIINKTTISMLMAQKNHLNAAHDQNIDGSLAASLQHRNIKAIVFTDYLMDTIGIVLNVMQITLLFAGIFSPVAPVISLSLAYSKGIYKAVVKPLISESLKENNWLKTNTIQTPQFLLAAHI